MKKLSEMGLQKKKIEEEEKKIKSQLEKVMDEYGIKSIDNEFLRITKVLASTYITLDTKKIDPEIYEQLPKKEVKRKASIRFDIK